MSSVSPPPEQRLVGGVPGAPGESGESGGTAQRTARNASLLAVGTIVARLSTFALAIVMARVLGAAQVGRYGFAGALATMVVPVADVGLTSWIVREVARSREEVERSMARLLGLKVAMTALVLAAVAVPTLATSGTSQVGIAVIVVLLATLADDWSQFVFGYFRGREAMGYESRSTAITAIARSAGGMAIALITGDLVPVLVWMLVTSLAQALGAGARLRGAMTAAVRSAAQAPPRLAYGGIAAMGMIGIFATVYLRADSVIIGALYDDKTLGYYTTAYALVTGLQIVPWMIANAAAPVFARSHGASEGLFESSWQEGLRAVLVLSLPFALVTSILAGSIIGFLFGSEFAPAGPALAILVWSSPVWALNMLLAGLLRGAGRTKLLAVVTGGGAVVNIAANLWAVRHHGINGAAVVTVATEGVVLLALAAVALVQGIVRRPRLPLARLALALVALAGAAVVARPLPVIVAGALALVAYGLTVRLTGVITRADVAMLRAAARRTG